jgi:HK97 family phage portal protein
MLGDSHMPVRGKRGPLWEESALGACIRFACDTFPEAPIEVRRLEGDKPVPIPGHALTQLLRRPNPYYPGLTLWAGTMLSLIVDGNAYWVKAFSQGGKLSELWYVPHWRMRPRWPNSGAEFISHYTYNVNGQERDYPPDEVVHFRLGLDPHSDGRKGLSRVKAILQEVLTDAEAAVAAHALMRTRGIPGAIASPKDPSVELDDDQALAISNRYEQLTGQGRGGLMVLNNGVEVEWPVIDVEKMAFERIRGISSERICAAVGLDPMVVGLPSQNKTYSNYAEAREAAYESFIIPIQRVCAETLNIQLLPDLGEERQEEVAFDLDQVRVLQGDHDKLWDRVGRAYQAGIIARGQAQGLLGLNPPDPSDVYLTDVVGTPQETAAKRLMAGIGETSRRRRVAYEEMGELDAPDD